MIGVRGTLTALQTSSVGPVGLAAPKPSEVQFTGIIHIVPVLIPESFLSAQPWTTSHVSSQDPAALLESRPTRERLSIR